MAVKLPDFESLRQLPNMGRARPVARYDVSPIAKGGEAVGAAVGAGGEAILTQQGGDAIARSIRRRRQMRSRQGGGAAMRSPAVGQGGEAIAQGERAVGAGVGNAAGGVLDYQLDKGRFEDATARSGAASDLSDLHTKYAGDQNADGQLVERYAEYANAIRDNSAQTISLPGLRDRFVAEMQPTIEQHIVGAQTQARDLFVSTAKANIADMGQKTAIDALKSDDPQTISTAIANHKALIEAAQSYGVYMPLEAQNEKATWAEQYGMAVGVQRSKTDPRGVLSDLSAAPSSTTPSSTISCRPRAPAAAAPRALTVSASSSTRTGCLIKKNRPDLAEGTSDQDLLAMRADPNLGRQMVTAYMNENRAGLKSAGIAAPTPGDLYLAHFLGLKGAIAVINADPDQPVAKALAAAVGPDKAAKMITANPGVLGGKLNGSVLKWADDKMGPTTAGGASIFDHMTLAGRSVLFQHAQEQLGRQTTSDVAGLQQRVQDTTAEAMNSGLASNPVNQGEFIAALGVEKGAQAFQAYQGELKVAADRKRVAAMSPQEEGDLLDQYEPQAGQGYAGELARQQQLRDVIAKKHADIVSAPAEYAIRNLPASAEAFDKLVSTISDQTASDDDRQAAARDYAPPKRFSTRRTSVCRPPRKILPASYVDQFNKAVATASDPTIRRRGSAWSPTCSRRPRCGATTSGRRSCASSRDPRSRSCAHRRRRRHGGDDEATEPAQDQKVATIVGEAGDNGPRPGGAGRGDHGDEAADGHAPAGAEGSRRRILPRARRQTHRARHPRRQGQGHRRPTPSMRSSATATTSATRSAS